MSPPDGEDVARARQSLNRLFQIMEDGSAKQRAILARAEERSREIDRESQLRMDRIWSRGHEMRMALLEFEMMRMQHDAMMARTRMMKAFPPGTPIIGEVQELIMGDRFDRIGSGATIVNRSTLVNSVNRIGKSVDADTARAFERLAGIVENSRSSEAIENFNGLAEELERPQPSKARMKSFWNGITGALPGVVELADVADKITRLFR